MPAIRIENKTDDDIIISFDGEEVECPEGGNITFNNCQKCEHVICVHRKRIPKESVNQRESRSSGPDISKSADAKPGSHVQLDSEIRFETIASKAVVSIMTDVNVFDTLHEDVLFVGYRADVSGAKLVEVKDRFASYAVKKDYMRQQIKGAFLPVGIIGMIVSLMGLLCLFFNIGGYSLKIAGNAMTLPYSLLLSAGGLCVLIFFIVTVRKIKKRAKELWQ